MTFVVGFLLAVMNPAAAGFIDLDPSEIGLTPIEGEDLVCERDGGMIAIDLEKRRVWQSDPGLTDGIEFEVSGWSQARCGLHLAIEATLAFGDEKAYYSINVDKKDSRVELKAVIRRSPGDQETVEADFTCRPVGKTGGDATRGCG